MRTYKRTILFSIILIILNLLINSIAKTPIDIISAIIVGLMLSKISSWLHLSILACISDFINLSPFGSHLLAIVIISYSTDMLCSYFWNGNNLRKFICNLIHLLVLIFIISLITDITGRNNYSISGVTILITLFLPIWQLMLNRLMETEKNYLSL